MTPPFVGRTCYGGVKLVDGPDMANIEKLDRMQLPMLDDMQENGILVDPAQFHNLRLLCKGRMEELRDSIRQSTGVRIDPNKDQEVADLLFRRLNLPIHSPKLTKKKTRESVNKDQLGQYRHLHPVIPMLIEYSEVSTIESNFCNLPELVGDDGRLHTRFGYTRVPSGRLNSGNRREGIPNVLNIPSHEGDASALGKEVRKGIIEEPGWVIVVTDMKQIEPRWIAAISAAKVMLEAFREGQDLYVAMASKMFGVDESQVTKGQRFQAKTVVLAIGYKITSMGLKDQMEKAAAAERAKGLDTPVWTESECQALIDSFFQVNHEVLAFLDESEFLIRASGGIFDYFGRWMAVPHVYSVHKYIQEEGIRFGCNGRIQAPAQGTMKLAMGKLWDTRHKFKGAIRFLLQEHDAMVVGVLRSAVEEWINHCEGCMKSVIDIGLPIASDSGWGLNWAEAKG